MRYSPNKAIKYYKENGLSSLLSKISCEVSLWALSIISRILDTVFVSGTNNIIIIPRNFTVDQDTISLISLANEETIYIAVPDTNDVNKELLQELRGWKLIKLNSISFCHTIAKSKIILFKDYGVTYHYRLLASRDKKFVRIPHGIPAKGAGSSSSRSKPLCNILDCSNLKLRNYTKSVTTNIVGYYWANDDGRNISMFKKYGFPRFDRIKKLAKDNTNSQLPQEVKDIVSSPEDHYDILYAPTHKDGIYETTLFPFADHNKDKLYKYLDKNNIRIFIRMHPNEEGNGIEQEYINGESILDGGNDLFYSAAELMPYFDALITDYSSIYLDYVLFDNPIIFVQDNITEYRNIRGFAFDYNKYWPGAKITTEDELFKVIDETVVNGNGKKYSYERRFVRDVLHKNNDKTFIESIKSDDGQINIR